jgi:multicomponent K+:H+ antiporter subunit D
LVVLVILSGLAALVAMMRSGIRIFWAPLEVIIPRVLVVEVAPIVALLALCMVLAVQGGAVLSYTDAAAQALHAPSSYIQSVLGAGHPPGVSR